MPRGMGDNRSASSHCVSRILAATLLCGLQLVERRNVNYVGYRYMDRSKKKWIGKDAPIPTPQKIKTIRTYDSSAQL